MDSYASLLERTRVPQPSIKKFAVISIFSKLRSAPSYLDPDSAPGRDAIAQCINSSSPPVVDQSVRELCCLVADFKLDLSRGLLELQSALEGSDPKFVSLFVKGLGFLIRVGFKRKHGSWRFGAPENHPFVKILSSRVEVHSELVHQVLLLMAQNRELGMVEVSEFLRPFLSFSILLVPFSDLSASLFLRELISSMASFCCSYPCEAIPVLKLLARSISYLPHKNLDELRNSSYYLESVVDAYTVVLKRLVGTGLLVAVAQKLGVKLSEDILSLLTHIRGHSGGIELIVELVKRLLVVQEDLALQYVPELSSVMLSLFIVLIESELEHDQLSLLKLLTFLIKWKRKNTNLDDITKAVLDEELLFMFPVINLMSSASRPVKGAASDLLVMLEHLLVQLLRHPRIELSNKGRTQSIGSPGLLVYRLLQHLWFQDQFLQSSFFINFASGCKTSVKGIHNEPNPWSSQLREHSLHIIQRRKSSHPITRSQEIFLAEMPPLLSAINGVLVMHQSLGNTAIDLLAAIGVMDPRQGVPLLLCILFYCNIFTKKDFNWHNLVPRLLVVLPSLASSSVMIPLVVQTILPMLQKDGNAVLFATGARLLCQTWEINDRAFGSLQAVLLPQVFKELKYERNICISLAASVRDVCRKNPDRGVDLILSVSACIESQDSIIQSLGFQSLAHLCEADVIDFYTAWDVIEKHVLDYSTHPVLAQSLCLLLRWGAMDAGAYSEISRNVLQTLWVVASSRHVDYGDQWTKTRVIAFESLTQYEVPDLVSGIPDFKKANTDLLLSETNLDVLKAMEAFEVKIIDHEHMNRRRLIKDKKVAGNKVEKLLDVCPQVLFPSGGKHSAGQLPGAALLCLSFNPKNLNNHGRVLQDVHTVYQNTLLDIAASLQLSRNIFIALLSLQSWKSFMSRWIKGYIATIDAKVSSVASDKMSKVANDILKVLLQLAEDSIPRSAENIALAIGALCMVLPPSAHTIKAAASKFLLNCLFQHEHEFRQWTAAISLGLISSCLHVTDHKQKFQNINGLMEVLCCSRSILVKGACAVGLGFSCHDLARRIQTSDNTHLEKEKLAIQEVDMLGKIVRTLVLMISPFCQASHHTLEALLEYFPKASDETKIEIGSERLFEKCDLEEDIWGVSGLVFGVGSSVSALYRAGAHEAMSKIKDLIISWIPHLNTNFPSKGSDKFLSVGSCLVLPSIVAFFQRVEMISDNELGELMNGYSELISELTSVKMSGAFHQSLLLASSVGAGNLIACILNEGVHCVEFEQIKNFLDLFRKCYSNPHPNLVHLGGMLGVVNAMGAGAGILVDGHLFSSSANTGPKKMESTYMIGPLLSSHVIEPHLTTLIQEMFLVAQNSDDLQMQQNASWVLSFLRNHLWSKKLGITESSAQTNVADPKTVSHSFSEDSLVMKLSVWLMHHNYTGEDQNLDVGTIITVLSCLSQAPRLPIVDWGSVVRRCMRYEVQVSEFLRPNSVLKQRTLRQECLKFSMAHADQLEPLLTFLDELTDLPRFSALGINMQSFLLLHLAGLIKIFSGSRLEKLFCDIADFFTSNNSFQVYNPDKRSSLRISCWKGLYHCLDDPSLNCLDSMSSVDKCIQVLFQLLPVAESTVTIEADLPICGEEWSEVVKCLAKAKDEWLLDFLQVSLLDLTQGDDLTTEVLKKLLTMAKLVRMGSIPLMKLSILKAWLLNSKSRGIWHLLVEVVAALQFADGSVKSQWLVDAVEISCVSSYPSTALQFVGLLSGSCCKYMPLLTLDQLTVLSDLPITLTSLLSDPNWQHVAESIVSNLCASTERIYSWVSGTGFLDDTLSTQPIDETEREMAAFLLQVMHQACVTLKEHLPLEKQLRLADMAVS
ncbi:hypothetical protein K2173_020093 [Erythroxylum novogranatense]|uniref:DUF3730 domain-containing protein n=1 Tax=Erythroxylum novogranatense TaxID=1862640 RepID=A0AAV8UA78_9ROSI|nr:hypothetical protein K2173_020093 [Erythroxylum novogranatense]